MCNHNKQARREERREERFHRREEKYRRRQEKLRLKAEKYAMRHGCRNHRRNSDPAIIHFHTSSILPTTTLNYYYQYSSQMPGVRQTTQLRPMDPVQVEEMVATLRTMFPDCDPQYIRNCLSQETSNHVQKVADKLIESSYPKIIITSSVPSAPQLPPLDSEFELDPPSYEEATIRPEPAESAKNERPVSWGGSPNKDNNFNAHTNNNNNTSSRSQPSSSTSTRSNAATPSTSSTSTSSSFTSRYSPAIKSVRRMAGTGPVTVQQVCDTYSSTLTRPVPIHFTQSPPPTFTQPFIIIPKDGTTIQKGFPIHSYPTPALESHDISYQDWVNFIKGLNMLVGVSNSSDSSIIGNLSANLRSMVIGNNERQMEEYVGMVNEYLRRWNDGFFRPRRMEMEFVSKKAVKNGGGVNIFKNKSDCVQYLLVKSA